MSPRADIFENRERTCFDAKEELYRAAQYAYYEPGDLVMVKPRPAAFGKLPKPGG